MRFTHQATTSSEWITLLQIEDRHPRLTEEEERWHGALIGNTPYGLLFKVIDTLEFDFSALEERRTSFEHGVKLIVGPRRTYLRYSYPFEMLEAFAIPDQADDTSRAFDEAVNLRAYNLARYFAKKMEADSFLVQESVAKYLAFLAAENYYTSDRLHESLSEIYHSTMAFYSELLPAYGLLDNALGSPLDLTSSSFSVKKHLAYWLGKAALSGPDLDHLAQQAATSLRRDFLEGDFFSATTPNHRFKILIDNFEEFSDITYLLDETEQPVGAEEQTAFNTALQRLSERATAIFKAEGVAVDDGNEPAAHRALKLSYTFPAAFAGIVDHFGKGHFNAKAKPDGTCVELSPLTEGAGRRIHDTAFQVYTHNRVASDPPKSLARQDLLAILSSTIRVHLTVLVVPRADMGLSLTVFPLLMREESLGGAFEPHPNFATGLQTDIVDFSELARFLTGLTNDEVTLIFPGLIYPAIAHYRRTVASETSALARAIFLDPLAKLWQAPEADWIQFLEGSPGASAAGYWDPQAQQRLGMLQVQEFSGNTLVGSLSCVPHYFRELLDRDFVSEDSPISIRHGPVSWPAYDVADWYAYGAAAAFETAFLFDCMPDFFHDWMTEVDPWTFFLTANS